MALHHSPLVVTNGLVMYLDAGNTKSYPGSGTTWYDLTGNGLNGSINSGEFISSSFGGYLQNTNNQSNFFYITFADYQLLYDTFSTTTGGWTIEEVIWTNSTNYPEADAGSVFSDSAYGSAQTGFDWNHGYGINQFQFGQSSNTGGSYEDVGQINIPSQYAQFNTWRMRTMIWNRTANLNSLYINGDSIGSINTPNTAGTSIYDHGTSYLGTLYGWKHYGRRACVKVYNKALSQSEVTQNFNALRTRFGI